MADPAHLPKPIEGVEASRAWRLSPLAMVAGCAFGWLAITQTTDGAALAESGPDAADLTGAVSAAQQTPVATGPQIATGPPPDPKPGDTFRDCPDCPEMVVVPAGSFVMGSSEDEKGRDIWEGPQHEVKIARPFAVGVYEVTFAEWDACVADGGCNGYDPSDEGWGRATRPVINVSWQDAYDYVQWLREKTGRIYDLLSESQWEYVARAGSQTRFWWGNDVGANHANCQGCGSRWDNRMTAPVGSFAPNAFGVYDTAGNVFEWVVDMWHGSYAAPADGSAWISQLDPAVRVVRGGDWNITPNGIRSAFRFMLPNDDRERHNGFRVARPL